MWTGNSTRSYALGGDVNSPRLVTSRTNIDHTDRMVNWSREKMEELQKEIFAVLFSKVSLQVRNERVRFIEKMYRKRRGLGYLPRFIWIHFLSTPLKKTVGFTIQD